jgi:hypothetical protein
MQNSIYRSKITSLTVAISCASFAFAGGSRAATISGGSFTNPLQTTEINQTSNLFKFNQALGTLTSATLTFTGQLNQTFTGTNRASGTQTARIIVSTALNLSIPGLTLSNPNNGSPAITFSQNTGVLSYAANQTRTFGPFTPSNTVNYVFPPNASLAFFNGTGQAFSVNCTTVTTTTVQGGGGNINSTQNTQAGCGASILYTYTPAPPPITGVPEPSTVLGILAIAGTGSLVRRKR